MNQFDLDRILKLSIYTEKEVTEGINNGYIYTFSAQEGKIVRQDICVNVSEVLNRAYDKREKVYHTGVVVEQAKIGWDSIK